MLSKIKAFLRRGNSASGVFSADIKENPVSDCKETNKIKYDGHSFKLTLLICFCLCFFAMFVVSRGQNFGGVPGGSVYSMYLGERFMGNTSSPREGLECFEKAKQHISSLAGEVPEADCDFRFSLCAGKAAANEDKLTENLFGYLMEGYKEGTGFYFDGMLVAANESRQIIEDFVEMIKASAINNATLSVPGKVENVEIANDIRVETKYYPLESFKTEEYLYSLKKDFVDEKMMLRSVETVSVGTRLAPLPGSTIKENRLAIDCNIEYTTETQIEIPHNVDYILDDSRPAGEVEIVRLGKDGIVNQVYLTTIANGEETTVSLGEEVLKQPQKGIISIGTAVQINSPAPSQESGFEWPSDGKVSSPFGPRSRGFHWGIDICGPEGSIITAAKDGVVVFSGYKANGYGNYVIIQHNEEESTLYSHNLSNSVSVGDYVVKGQEVAKMGMTGRATGNHVHFEVRINGVKVDPEDYLPERK